MSEPCTGCGPTQDSRFRQMKSASVLIISNCMSRSRSQSPSSFLPASRIAGRASRVAFSSRRMRSTRSAAVVCANFGAWAATRWNRLEMSLVSFITAFMESLRDKFQCCPLLELTLVHRDFEGHAHHGFELAVRQQALHQTHRLHVLAQVLH